MSGKQAAPRQNLSSLDSALEVIDQKGAVSTAPATVYRSDYAVRPVSPSAAPAPESLRDFLRSPRGRLAALTAAAAFALGSAAGLIGLAPLHDARSGSRGTVIVATQREVLPAPSCLRDSTQTIRSEARDQLLLDAASAHEAGKPEQAIELLRKYTAEACDRATLDALDLLERQLRGNKKER